MQATKRPDTLMGVWRSWTSPLRWRDSEGQPEGSATRSEIEHTRFLMESCVLEPRARMHVGGLFMLGVSADRRKTRDEGHVRRVP